MPIAASASTRSEYFQNRRSPLMRTSIAERLYRIVRQTAKELGKRANFDIVGGQVELDRSVLDKMLAPIEHMLRNAVAHGIEDREQRIAAGLAIPFQQIGDLAKAANRLVHLPEPPGRGAPRCPVSRFARGAERTRRASAR